MQRARGVSREPEGGARYVTEGFRKHAERPHRRTTDFLPETANSLHRTGHLLVALHFTGSTIHPPFSISLFELKEDGVGLSRSRSPARVIA